MTKKSKTARNLAHYMSLPYQTVLYRDEDADVIARIDELPGCIAHGKNEAEALANLASMKRLWLEDCIEGSETAPEPDAPETLPSAVTA